MPIVHAPYAAGKRPFTIGLAPVETGRWIEPGADLDATLALKDAILATEPDAFGALPGSEPGQAELLALLADHLPAVHPAQYSRSGEVVHVGFGDRRVALTDRPPLRVAARLVPEDLLLLRRDRDGWRLAAGALCFPSTWRLADKLGRGLEAIHAPVPGYAGQMAGRVARIFDSLPAGPVLERFNWSIYGDARLRHAEARQAPEARFPPGDLAARAHIRIERQTLRRLPASGDMLFTVRIHVDPATALAADPRGPALAAALRHQLAALDPAELAYKGLGEARGRLLEALAAPAAR